MIVMDEKYFKMKREQLTKTMVITLIDLAILTVQERGTEDVTSEAVAARTEEYLSKPLDEVLPGIRELMQTW